MKKAAALALVSTLLFSALAGTLIVNTAEANPYRPKEDPPPPVIHVLSPEPNATYTVNSVTLTFTVDKSSWGRLIAVPAILPIQYLLDGEVQGQFSGDDVSKPFSVVLTGLSDGQHCVEVTASSKWKVYFDGIDNPPFVTAVPGSSGIIYFTVDTVAPRVSILGLQGRTFDGAEVPFNFTVNEAVSWIGYSLDGADAVAIADVVVTRAYGRDNYYVVLAGLAAGSHSLTVYAEDEAGRRGESEAIGFAVSGEAQPETEPSGSFPTVLVATASASVAVVGAALLLYFKKRKH
jgi:hypothetical protein